MTKLARAFTDPKLLVVLLLGFSSGLPLLLVGATLKGWAFNVGVDLRTVGYFALVRLPYTCKFLWAPLLDRYAPPLGRRRGWMLISQVTLVLAFLGLTRVDPAADTIIFCLVAFVAAFASATQDIVIDAYRREVLPTEELGLGTSLAVLGYRFGTLLASSGAFILADRLSWPLVYAVMAAFMAIGVLTAIFCPEPPLDALAPRTLRDSVIAPLREFFGRRGALTILSFILLYKVGESLASEVYNQFYLALDFTKTEIGAITKLFGVWSTILGGLAGGALMVRLGIYRALWIFGVLQSAALLLFAALAEVGHSVPMLGVAVCGEYFTSGMATTAFLSFMATQTDRRFTAVQYALLSSLMTVPSILLGSLTGHLAVATGWTLYFVVCAVLTLPGLALLVKVRPLIREAD